MKHLLRLVYMIYREVRMQTTFQGMLVFATLSLTDKDFETRGEYYIQLVEKLNEQREKSQEWLDEMELD